MVKSSLDDVGMVGEEHFVDADGNKIAEKDRSKSSCSCWKLTLRYQLVVGREEKSVTVGRGTNSRGRALNHTNHTCADNTRVLVLLHADDCWVRQCKRTSCVTVVGCVYVHACVYC